MPVALVTGSSGFIGYFTCKRLLESGFRVYGIDAMTNYYDVSLKERRRDMLLDHEEFSFIEGKIETPGALMSLFEAARPDVAIHLAAQAGVRYSIDNPRVYMEGNIAGTFELLEAARAFPPAHVLLASTSSAYGASTNMPYREIDESTHQMSFYAATKKATESMAHSYAHLFGLPITIFRFFTVYGPWGRPDMALFKFTKSILEGTPVNIYNFGDMKRDFTYIEDLVEAVSLLIDTPPVRPILPEEILEGDSLSPVAPWRVVNIGNSNPVQLLQFVDAIEAVTGRKAQRNLLPMQAGDVPSTWADTNLLKSLTSYAPRTNVRDGVAKFVEWYKDFYQVA